MRIRWRYTGVKAIPQRFAITNVYASFFILTVQNGSAKLGRFVFLGFFLLLGHGVGTITSEWSDPVSEHAAPE